jgi:hypothetical protein
MGTSQNSITDQEGHGGKDEILDCIVGVREYSDLVG